MSKNSENAISKKLMDLDNKIKSLRKKLGKNGGSTLLLEERQAITPDVIFAGFDTRNTKFETQGRKLNKDGGKLYRDILTEIPVKQLKEEMNSKDLYTKCYAARTICTKFDYKAGVSDSWLSRNKKNYYDWAELSLKDKRKDCSDGYGFDKINLAVRYIDIENYTRAIELLKEALKADDVGFTAAKYLGELYSDGSITPDGLKAKKYFEIGVNFKDPKSMINLAEMYISGNLIKEDLRKAFLLTNKAYKIDPDDPYAVELLADCYRYGWGTRVNEPKAFKLYFSIGENYSSSNTIRIAQAYISGIGLDKNVSKGIKLLKKLEKEGDKETCYHLGKLYLSGIDVRQDYKKAFDYFLISSSADIPYNIRSYIELGKCYFFGIGTNKNLKKSQIWFEKAYFQEDSEYLKEEAHYWLEDELNLTAD